MKRKKLHPKYFLQKNRSTIYLIFVSLLVLLVLGAALYKKLGYKSRAEELASPEESNTEIIGGSRALMKDWPFLVLLTYFSELGPKVDISPDHLHCAGTLVSPEWVLTAGHCAGNEMYSTVYVVGYNEYGLRQLIKTESYPKAKITKGNRFNTPVIALLKLSKKLNIETARLPEKGMYFPEKTVVKTAGWGTSGFESKSFLFVINFADYSKPLYPTTLLETKLQIKDPGMWSAFSFDPSLYYYTGSPDEEVRSTCYGDSGGPLVYPADGRKIVIGVTADGDSKCDNYSYFTRVQEQIDWIQKTMIDNK